MKKILLGCLSLMLLMGCSSNDNPKGIEAKDGDIVNIDFVGKHDGTAFDGGTAEGSLLELGSNSFINGFEDQVVGMKTGEEKTIHVTFPTNYQVEDLAGEDATFDVTLNKVYRVTDETAATDDIVKIEAATFLDGKEVTTYARQTERVDLSASSTYNETLKEALTGVKKDENVVLNTSNTDETTGLAYQLSINVIGVYKQVMKNEA